MIVFPNAKINLGLHVLEKRNDGFHNIETVFYPVALKDALEIIAADERENDSLAMSGIDLETESTDNICLKAVQLAKEKSASLANVKIWLHKNIPAGAGLGGGSADGAFMLQLLNKKFKLGWSDKQLGNMALQLGSDCPFFILNKPAVGSGRGEVLSPVDIDLSAHFIAIINPGIHVNTGWAFSRVIPKKERSSLMQIIQLPLPEWRHHLQNDFEEPVFEQYPEIAEIKSALYHSGAVYASLSGSGSTVYGIFNTTPSLPVFPPHYFVKIV